MDIRTKVNTRPLHPNLLARNIHLRVLLTIFLCFVGFPVTAADQEQACERFAHYIFMRDWSPSVCIKYAKEGAMCIIPNASRNWIVHGLWPSAPAGERLFISCDGPEFSRDAVSGLEPALDTIWPNPEFEQADTTARGRTWAWRHEWEKHGTCAALCDPQVDGQSAYFQLAMDLNKRYDIASVLDHAGIMPNAMTPIASVTLVNVLKKAFGVNPIIECVTPNRGDTAYLYAIGLCFSKSHDPLDCHQESDTSDASCPATVIYPTQNIPARPRQSRNH
ncbi:Ribonuclease I [Thiorhodovibrio winogradskyi]|uniref:Ribonuclease I n=2 Tax=Thiorhodovibrio winogradskyi TaxID=77007 RepID=A0ABZ0SBQ4_9GAMM